MHPLEPYFQELHAIRASGAGVPETSGYGALAMLLNAIGATLKPKVRCVINLHNQGAGLPDGGLFTPEQFQRATDGEPLPGQLPGRGAIEVKSVAADLDQLAASEQVAKYLAKYGQVLVTNYREFLLVTPGPTGQPLHGERYHLAESETAFWATLAHPHKAEAEHSKRFTEYLQRVMRYPAPLTAPADLAWFLASYARDAHARVDAQANLPALAALRTAMENALGMIFQAEQGEHFFRSTLVQTLFYGVFAAWVLWHRENPARTDRFDWRLASYYLNVPVIQALFEQVSAHSKLKALGLIEPLDWAGAALDRVDRAAFFARFEEEHAVQYFYEPFLQAYDPELRKQLGVWYTPPEIIRYMVARVDAVLRQELGVADGLADPDVYILDPCCGTGGFLVATLALIAETLAANGEEGLLGARLKQAATQRVFGFEILPAPLVIAHMQIGLALSRRGAPLAEDERAGVYLTNALTGWEPPDVQKEKALQQLLIPFPELAHERDAASEVKHHGKILVVLGNPPYNGLAGVAIGEERVLSNAYRTTQAAPAPQGQGLNDLYVRFYRMAERRIVEQTGRGVVCFISNYSWLDGLSFTGMRERYLDVFDHIWIDCLNGDKFKTGKLTPKGEPDPSVFSTEFNREGIQVGTAIALLARTEGARGAAAVRFRHLWGKTKRAELLASLSKPSETFYQVVAPPLALGLPFMPGRVQADYSSWPLLPDLMPQSIPGINTSRDLDLVQIDRLQLERRLRAYFDPALDDSEVANVAPSLMTSSTGYDARATRRYLLQRGMSSGQLVRYAYRPFDPRWVYWHPETRLIDRNREDLFAAVQIRTIFLTSRQKAERTGEGTPFYVTRHLPDRHLTRPGSACFPLQLPATGQPSLLIEHPVFSNQPTANLSPAARVYLASLGIPNPDGNAEIAPGLRPYELIWLHSLAIGYAPAYLRENGDGIRGDWPRIPLPAGRAALLASAALGRKVAALLDTERPIPGVTQGTVRPDLKPIAVLARAGGGSLDPAAGDLDVTAGWGHAGKGGVTMPGRGRLVERPRQPFEVSENIEGLQVATTLDIYLSDVAYWRNVPVRVWDYTIGGYQVIKKWLSYRERNLLGRGLTVEEAQEVTDMARRIAAILLLERELDANYVRVAGETYAWQKA